MKILMKYGVMQWQNARESYIKKLSSVPKKKKDYLIVIFALARKAELLISDCDFEEYADYEDWQELFSNVYYDCMILQIGKEKKAFWWKNAEVYYHAQENGFTKEIAEKDLQKHGRSMR